MDTNKNIIQVGVMISILVILSNLFPKLTLYISSLFDVFVVRFLVLAILVYVMTNMKHSLPLVVVLMLFFILSIQYNKNHLTAEITENYNDPDLDNIFYTKPIKQNNNNNNNNNDHKNTNTVYNNNDCINPNPHLVSSQSHVCSGINNWNSGYSTQGLGNKITGLPTTNTGSRFN